MKNILVIDINDQNLEYTGDFLGEQITIKLVGCNGDINEAKRLIKQYDGKIDAIGIDGIPAQLQLADVQRPFQAGVEIRQIETKTPLVDGSGVRATLESWSMILADRIEPGIFSKKRVLLVPGLNHAALVRTLHKYTTEIKYSDPVLYFALPDFPGAGTKQLAKRIAAPTLEQLTTAPPRRVFPQPGSPRVDRSSKPFEWADILAGDIGAILRYSPEDLRRKTVLCDWANIKALEELQRKGVSIVVNLIPSFGQDFEFDYFSAAMMEAMLVALRKNKNLPLNENTYLDLISELNWQPVIHHLQPDDANVNRFAFVIHPLKVDFIHKHKWFRWTRYLPDSLVEAIAAYIPPIYLSRITGGQSPTTGQKIEGYLISLGATPREMVRHNERFTYNRLVKAASMSERLNARIMGLGAFTSVVGDAGITVANESDIAITSGNSLTVAATLEAAKQAVQKMGAKDLTKGKAMVVGATGSIGSVCSRLLAQAIFDVVLVSIDPAKLIDLKKTILDETPGAEVTIATRADEYIQDCDLIVTSTSAFGQRIIDITKCKPGAVICDVARPPDISKAEADLRPDVLVIESGEVLIPGDIDFGYDIGLPPKTAYACLAETALLAMEGVFEDYTLGRNITMERVKDIYRLFKKHEFQIAGLRSFGDYVTDDFVVVKREKADELRNNPALFEVYQREASIKLADIPVSAKGVSSSASSSRVIASILAGAALSGILLYLLKTRRK